MTNEVTAFIGLGSNLDDPKKQIETAFKDLSNLRETCFEKSSSLYKSHSILPGKPIFFNAAAKIRTKLSPYELLTELKKIEIHHNRTLTTSWGDSRTLDLDILLYGNETLDTPLLRIPHPELTNRDFVLLPLLDLEKDLTLPCGRVISMLLEACQNRFVVEKDLS